VLVVVLIAVVLNATDPPTLLLAIFGTYAVSAPIIWLVRRLRRLRRAPA
jgi:hypothetical protein